jgi:hypothetical protein
VADALDGDRTEVGIVPVGLDGRGREELVPACGVDAPHWDPCLLERRHRVEAEEVAHGASAIFEFGARVWMPVFMPWAPVGLLSAAPDGREKPRPHRANPQAPDTLLSLQRSFEPLVWRSDLRHQIPDQRFFR